MRVLALDIGRRRTGVAYYDDATHIPLPLDTLVHDGEESSVQMIAHLCESRSIDTLVVGLPLLPSGREGAQSAYVRGVVTRLPPRLAAGVQFVDERHTTESRGGSDAQAALCILTTYLERTDTSGKK